LQLFNSHFNGWETQLPALVNNELAFDAIDGFNCKTPFIKHADQTQIHIQFYCKANVGLQVSVAETNMQQVICVEKEYNAGLHKMVIDLNATNTDTMYLLCIKSIGKFKMESIELV
jgi:hypothetical protein